jgi:predicted DNA-binding antitoxin AbrB/MazE fold protein
MIQLDNRRALMGMIHAIYENGVFKPKEPVSLPDQTEVVFEPQLVNRTFEPKFLSDPNPSPEAFARLLDEMAARPPGKTLPPDFSRADIYDDHD